MSSSFDGRIAPNHALTLPGNHGGADHRRLALGFDLLSLVGNPHRFMKSLFSQPEIPNGLTYIVFNRSHGEVSAL